MIINGGTVDYVQLKSYLAICSLVILGTIAANRGTQNIVFNMSYCRGLNTPSSFKLNCTEYIVQ